MAGLQQDKTALRHSSGVWATWLARMLLQKQDFRSIRYEHVYSSRDGGPV